MYSFGSRVLGAAAPKPPLIQFGYALISVLVRLTFTFGATFRHEEMLKVCPLKCKLAEKSEGRRKTKRLLKMGNFISKYPKQKKIKFVNPVLQNKIQHLWNITADG